MIVLDAGVLIGYLEGRNQHHRRARLASFDDRLADAATARHVVTIRT